MKESLNKILNFYIKSSIHVSLSVFALVQMTFFFCHLPFDIVVSLLAFCGTLFSYNFIKYEDYIRRRYKEPFSKSLKFIILMSVVALIISGYCFLLLNLKAKLITIGLLLLAVLYAIPIGYHKKNLRNWSGIKVYIVCLCWAVITVIVPLLNAGELLSIDIGIKVIQRFILVFVLIGIFEIVDLQYDDKYLKTLPQILGITTTKWLLALLLIPFFVIEFFKIGFQPIQAWNDLIIVVITLGFILGASPKRSEYYTHFWAESVPVIWWLLTLL